jgi:hypothetical protein
VENPRKHKVYQKYSMQLKKKLFLQTCVMEGIKGQTILTNFRSDIGSSEKCYEHKQ